MTEENIWIRYDKQEAKIAKIQELIYDRCFNDNFIDSLYEFLFSESHLEETPRSMYVTTYPQFQGHKPICSTCQDAVIGLVAIKETGEEE